MKEENNKNDKFSEIEVNLAEVVLTEDLVGKELSKPIYKNDTLLLVEGKILTKNSINLLWKNGVEKLYIVKSE